MRLKPYTNVELFQEICKIVELPNILDYSLATTDIREIRDYKCDIYNSLNYGINEGIYLDIGLEFPGKKIIPLGTFKTLATHKEAMWTMGILLADLVRITTEFINANLDDFDWQGYEIRGIKNEIVSSYSVTYDEYDKAESMIRENISEGTYDAMKLYCKPSREVYYFYKDLAGKIKVHFQGQD